MIRVIDYVSTARPLNSIGTGLGITLISSMFSGWRLGFDRVLIGFITGFAGTSSAMMINDYVDREVDRINKPWKPIPRGCINPNVVLTAGVSMLVLVVLLNSALGLELFLVTLFYATVSVAYSFLRRFWWSQLLVPLSTTSIVVYSYFSSGKPIEFLKVTLILSASIYLANLAREVVKALQDYEGDRRVGYSTIPIKFGGKTSIVVSITSGSIAVALNYIVCLIYKTSLIYVVLVTVANVVFTKCLVKLYVTFRELDNTPPPHELEVVRKRSLYSFLIAILAYSTLKTPY